MTHTRRQGFTLIEVLVVIGTISVLAGLLLPGLLRARESAHRAQCLANVRSIALAISMYLADWDRYWPSDMRQEVVAYFSEIPGHRTPGSRADGCNHTTQANPYLREPVLLEAYVGNREVWRCPSARKSAYARWIVPPGPGGDWLHWYQTHEGEWGRPSGRGPCALAFPPGWGGEMTDTLAWVGAYPDPEAAGVFAQAIGVNGELRDLHPCRIADPTRHVVCGDDGRMSEFWEMAAVAYPDDCRLSACGLWSGAEGCCRADGLDVGFYERFLTDPHLRKGYTRHAGGSNIGFADGHAKWFLAETIVAGTPPLGSDFQGIDVAWPTVGAEGTDRAH